MDLTRFFLYSALAVVTYLMLLQWQQDYPPLMDDDPAIQQQIPSIPDNSDNPAIADVPSDLPSSVPSAAGTANISADSSTNNVTTVSNAAGSITVKTDTLELEISLSGGDITYLALPLYLRHLDVPDDPFVILHDTPNRNYVAQSGLIGRNGIDSNGRAIYQAGATEFTMADSANELTVDLVNIAENGVKVTKRYHFQRDSYLIDVSYVVENTTSETWQANLFGQIKREQFEDPSNSGGIKRTFLGFVTTSEDDPYQKVGFDDIDDGTTPVDVNGGWIGFSQHYFLTAWIPQTDTINRFTTRKNSANQYIGEFTSSAFVVEPQSTNSVSAHYYAGPKDQYRLEEISPNLGLTIDYGFLWFLAAPIYWVLTHIDSLVGNYGFSIILLTISVKALLYKLSETQYRSMAGMRRLMPKMQQLKESYGDDKMKLQKATMELYKKEKINPFGGCLPMLVQMPVFIALYWVLLESVELRHAPFIFWLNDLSVRDPFFILPLMMGATMYLQTSLSPTPADPMQAKVMKFMPIMMTGLFLMFPAGLVLYWFTNGALGILQQWYITRKIEAAYEAKKAN